MSAARLTKTATGGYATPDGRWTVEPVTGLGEGVNGTGGWSPGRRAWRLTDTHRSARLAQYGDPHTLTLDALWRARDVIAAHS